MMIPVFLLLVCLLAGVVLTLLSFASSISCAPSIIERFRSEAQAYLRTMLCAGDILKSKTPEHWTTRELETYLFNALYAIQYAHMVFIWLHHRHPRSVEELDSIGVLDEWPQNPLNNWQPIIWMKLSEPFSPGDLVKQLCPPSEYSFPEDPKPITCYLSINGPSPEYVPLAQHTLVPAPWGRIPPGTAFFSSCGWEPIYRTLLHRNSTSRNAQA